MEAQRYRRSLEGLLGVPATEGNQIEVLRNGNQIFPAILAAIDEARSTVDFLTFVYWEGDIGRQVAEVLAQRARAGVRVRVLLDAFGAHTMDPSLVERMREAGCLVEWFRPLDHRRPWVNNHRTHRKVLICDEEVAFTGGVGIADEWKGDARGPAEWRDTHFSLRGPAVDGLRAAFLANWAESEHQIFDAKVDRFPAQPQNGESTVQVVRGESAAKWSDITTLMRSLLCLADQRLWITTAYFVPDPGTTDLLVAAARRGVEVRVLVPGPHADKRFVQLAGESRYQRLLDEGVRIWAYQPTMLHAKVLTVDGQVATVGSANFNRRSLVLDDEVNLVVFDPALVATLDEDFAQDLSMSRELVSRRWRRRSVGQRAKEAAATVVDHYF
ncbi:MAG: phospholipase D-like domain-containing protein [Acidimicrobiales bacterium]